jgi:hypothetical protein
MRHERARHQVQRKDHGLAVAWRWLVAEAREAATNGVLAESKKNNHVFDPSHGHRLDTLVTQENPAAEQPGSVVHGLSFCMRLSMAAET